MALYRVRPDKARACLDTLHALRHVHPYAVAYLGAVRAAHREGRTEGLLDPVQSLHRDYLEVYGGPLPNHPFVKLFPGKAKGLKDKAWQGKNLSGTYGTSGRAEEIRKVINMEKAGNRVAYSLPPDHVQRVLTHWFGGERLPVHPLALFLYRDLAFDLDAPRTGAWVEHFRAEFGYERDDGTLTNDYHTLFSEKDAGAYAPADNWLEAYEPPADEQATGDRTSLTPYDSAG